MLPSGISCVEVVIHSNTSPSMANRHQFAHGAAAEEKEC